MIERNIFAHLRGRGLSEWMWQNCEAALCSDEELFVVKREEEHGCLGHTHGGERQGIPIMGGTGYTRWGRDRAYPLGEDSRSITTVSQF